MRLESLAIQPNLNSLLRRFITPLLAPLLRPRLEITVGVKEGGLEFGAELTLGGKRAILIQGTFAPEALQTRAA